MSFGFNQLSISRGLPLITWRIKEGFFPLSLPHAFLFFHNYICCFFVLSLLGTKDGSLNMLYYHSYEKFSGSCLYFPPMLGNAIWLAVTRFERSKEFSSPPTLSSLFMLAEAVGIFVFLCSSVLWSKVHFLGLVQLLHCNSLTMQDLQCC